MLIGGVMVVASVVAVWRAESRSSSGVATGNSKLGKSSLVAATRNS
jgi:hypothetical protein